MARASITAFILVFLGAASAWGDVGTPGQSSVPQSTTTPGIFAQPFGPNQVPGQPGTLPGQQFEPEPGVTPIGPQVGPSPSPGSQQPGQVPNERLPTGTSCSGGLSSTPGFLCPEPGTLPGSIPSDSNANMFTGKTSSPTNPGSPGTIPGQSGSPLGSSGTPLNDIPTNQPRGFMTPQR